jgi:hypothetical protein
MKRILVVSAIFFTALVALLMTEGRVYAMRVYGAPCGQMSGFAGFLQQTHFLPAGTCSATPSGCSNPGAVCNISAPVSGAPTNGHCTTVDSSCVCK